MRTYQILIDLEQNALSTNYLVIEKGEQPALPRNTMPAIVRPGDRLCFFFKQGLEVGEVMLHSWPIEIENTAVLSNSYGNDYDGDAPQGYRAPVRFFNARTITCSADAGYFRFALVGRYQLREAGNGAAGALTFPFMVDQECIIRVGA